MAHYAIVNDADGDILNTIEWDGEMSPWHPDFIEGQTIRLCGDEVDQSWFWDGAQFVPPTPIQPPVHTHFDDPINALTDVSADPEYGAKQRAVAGTLATFLATQRTLFLLTNPSGD